MMDEAAPPLACLCAPCTPRSRVRAAPGRGLLLTLLTVLAFAPAAAAQEVVDPPRTVLGGVPFTLHLQGGQTGPLEFEILDAAGSRLSSGTVQAGAQATTEPLRVSGRGQLPLEVQVGGVQTSVTPAYAPGWFSLIPPLIAIALALLLREVVSALFAGIWIGALVLTGFHPLSATGRLVDHFVVPQLGDVSDGKTTIVVFSMMLGGMVGLIAKNGGTRGIVEALEGLATSVRRGKLATWLAGLAIFFDDYANTLLVGNTMRPITDRLRISREKLAYIVDSTAAPVAAIVPISTWVGYEIGLIKGGLEIAAEQQRATDPAMAAEMLAANPFTVFLHTIPYLFYPLLALSFVLMTTLMNRDLGPMAVAERRAARGEGLHRAGAMLAADSHEGLLEPAPGTPLRWWNAAIPVLAVVLVVLLGLLMTGRAAVEPGAGLREVLAAADPFATLLWGALAGVLTAVALSMVQRLLTMSQAVEAWVSGVRSMMLAMVILVLAWSLGAVTEELGTAAYLASLLEGALPLSLIPAIVFVISGAMAFATGTSWATMAVMLPLVIPLTVALGGGTGFAGGTHHTVLLSAISSVLAGAIWGDHCSPISDTTVMSSMASACDHVDHVRTQLPYALLVGAVGLVLGDLGTAFGLPVWVALPAALLVLWGVLRTFGTPVTEPA
ncbi:MAG: Na+/H+ antiporter NhaC family protein [Gemmatimonadota bacterium]